MRGDCTFKPYSNPIGATNGRKDLEKEIQDKGLTAPRTTPADIEANIVSEHYFTAAQGYQQAQEDAHDGRSAQEKTSPLHLLTFCVLVLRNGFTVTGESARASPANFNAEIGRQIARENAVDKVWPPAGLRVAEQAGCRLTPEITGKP